MKCNVCPDGSKMGMNGCDKGNKKEHQGQCAEHSETKHTHISLLGPSFSLSFQSGFSVTYLICGSASKQPFLSSSALRIHQVYWQRRKWLQESWSIVIRKILKCTNGMWMTHFPLIFYFLYNILSCDDSLFFECVGLYLCLRTIDYFWLIIKTAPVIVQATKPVEGKVSSCCGGLQLLD